MVTITDYERITTVPATQLGQIECPKCQGVCTEKSPERRLIPKTRRQWACKRCGRSWVQVPMGTTTIHQALEDDGSREIPFSNE